MNQLARFSEHEPMFSQTPEPTDRSETPIAPLSLQHVRHQRGWTQQEVADQLGVTVLTVSRWERALVQPRPPIAQRLCDLLQIRADQLGWVVPGSPSAGRAMSLLQHVWETPLIDPAIPTLEPTFRGRNDLLAWLAKRSARRFTKAGMPLCLALVGLPGVGKSTVACAFAHQMAQQCAFDVILWGCIGLSPNVHALLARWASLLGVSEQEQARLEGRGRWTNMLRATLGTRRCLVVLDDVWQLEMLAAMHLLTTGVYLLTTRSPDLAAAATSSPQEIVRVAPFSPAESLALLTMLAPGAVTVASAQADMLVKAVGGLPLALQLSGKYVQRAVQHGPGRIQQAFARLADPATGYHVQVTHPFLRDASRTLYEAIAQSDQSLDAAARQALRLLALLLPQLPHSFAEAAALAVLDGDTKALETLVNAGLLDYGRPDEQIDEVGRYRLHQVIVGYAQLTPIVEPDIQQAARARLLDWIMGSIRAAARPHQLDREAETLRMGIAHACSSGGPLLIEFALAIAPWLNWQGRASEGRAVLEQALVAAREQHTHALPDLLLQHGTLALKEGLLDMAETSLREGLAETHNSARTSVSATCTLLARLGEVAVKRNALTEARVWVEQGLDLARASGMLAEQADLLRHLGVIADLGGKLSAAERTYREGLALTRQIGHTYLECQLLLDMAILYGEQGNLDRAKRLLQQGVSQATRSGYRDLLCTFYDNLAYLSHLAGADAEAWTYARKSLAWARKTGQQEWIANSLLNAARILMQRQEYIEAEQLIAEATTIIERMGLAVLRSDLLETQADALLVQARLAEAMPVYEALRQLAITTGSVSSLGIAEYGLARVTVGDDLPQARAWASLAVRHLAEAGDGRLAEVQHWLRGVPREDGAV
jgi:transcriptional regulator with XRE-family HTH domain/tetratricopeptide (TPR) repeat protein